jgi:outer membrane protein assembly factor BamB
MKPSKSPNRKPGARRHLLDLLLPGRGTVLVYLIVVVLIFGVLGVIIVSLFTTATTSSATPNDARRAEYILESAKRYAMSELRNTNFDPETITDLNNLTYNVEPSESFTINVFGPWFDANANINCPVGTFICHLPLTVPEGKIPEGFTIPAGLWVVNYDHIGADFDLYTSRNPVLAGSSVTAGAATLTIASDGDMVVAKGERICLAVKPSKYSQSLASGDNLYVQRVAKDFFPEYNGAISINRRNYVYERLVDTGDPNEVVLENITAVSMPNALTPLWFTVTNPGDDPYSGEFIVLSPRNHIVIPSATVGAVKITGNLEDGVNIFDTFPAQAMTRNPDITADDLTSNLSEKETNQGFIQTETSSGTLNIGGGVTAGTGSTEFGAGWYNANKAIGGRSNVCQAGACQFGIGIRAFFILDYIDAGAGLVFSIVNALDNSLNSIGGDIQASELLGYAGDSRLRKDGLAFLDELGWGLRSPKIGLEFDTRTNYDPLFENNMEYCSSAQDLKTGTRNDPLKNDKHTVQYVFWGSDNPDDLNIPCRGSANRGHVPQSYDDNRHNAPQPWVFDAPTGNVDSSPVVASDGSIYFGSDDGNVYGVNPDGTLKSGWPVSVAGPVKSSPALNSDESVVYIGSDNGFYAIAAHNPGGTTSWQRTGIGAVKSSPAVLSDKIYFGSDNGHLYAMQGAATRWQYPAASDSPLGAVKSSPAIASDGTIYFGSDDGHLYAVHDDESSASLQWQYPATGSIGAITSSPAIDGNIIYFGSDDGHLYAVCNEGPSASLQWQYPATGSIGAVKSSPAIGSDGTIYFGSDDGNVYAVGSDGTLKDGWPFSTGDAVQSSPAVDSQGNIYFGSDDGFLYALYPNGTLNWQYYTSGNVRTRPAIKNSTVYVGTWNDELVALSPPVEVFNFRKNETATDRYLVAYDASPAATNPYLYDDPDTGISVLSPNWLSNPLGDTPNPRPWAIRMEVNREAPVSPSLNWRYTLKTWVRQCANNDCSNVTGTFFNDTRVVYNPTKSANLQQTIEFEDTDPAKFENFRFGFTAATGSGETQSITIKSFALSLIRPGDPEITEDPDWP